uniref:Legume lectin domain-containing protein n=1 Tax=Oryza punctata TaxID=4537 RepID=A0A0E0LGT3_ORYPU
MGSCIMDSQAVAVTSSSMVPLAFGEDGILTDEFQRGHCFHPQPVALFNSSSNDQITRSIYTMFIFSITPYRATCPASPVREWPSSSPLPTTSSWYGELYSNKLAVELNSVHRMDNVRVDLDSLSPIASASAGYHSFQPLSLTSGDLMQAWIDMTYDGQTFRLELTLASFPMNRPLASLLSCDLNLNSSTAAAIFGDDGYVYVGFSSSTMDRRNRWTTSR